MHRPLLKLFALLSLIPAFLACHSKPSEAPTVAAPSANTAPNPPPPPPIPTKPVVSPYEGRWQGDSGGEDLPLSFTVKGNVVSDIQAGYKMQKGGCSSFSNFTSDTPGTLTDKTFNGKGSQDVMKDHNEFNIRGTFTSDKEASGTLHWMGKSNLCGPIDTQSNWTAKKVTEGPDVEVPDAE